MSLFTLFGITIKSYQRNDNETVQALCTDYSIIITISLSSLDHVRLTHRPLACLPIFSIES